MQEMILVDKVARSLPLVIKIMIVMVGIIVLSIKNLVGMHIAATYVLLMMILVIFGKVFKAQRVM